MVSTHMESYPTVKKNELVCSQANGMENGYVKKKDPKCSLIGDPRFPPMCEGV